MSNLRIIQHVKKAGKLTHIERKYLSIGTDVYQTQMLKIADKEHYYDHIPCVEKTTKQIPNQNTIDYPNLNF